MEETTTSNSAPQGQAPDEAVIEDTGDEQLIVQDENGTPSLQPASQAQSEASAEEAPSASEAVSDETQATDDTDIKEWAEKKGLPLDDPVKLASMYREAEKKMHEATAQVPKSSVQPPELVAPSGDDMTSQLVERQNQIELKTYVRDWFEANPEMKDYREELRKISDERPYLTNMDDIRAHFLADPERLESLKSEGGRRALQNIAQKQQQQPPASGATNTQSFQTAQITPNNVYQLVEQNDQEWFEQNHKQISRAMEGKS